MAFHNIPPNGFPDLPDMEEVAGLASDVSNLSSSKANQITIAPFFNAEASYDPGDLVYYNGLSYRCVNAHEGEWDADDFAATTIAGELDALKSGLTDLSDIVNRQNQVLDLSNVTVPRANTKRYTFTDVNLSDKAIAIDIYIADYSNIDARIVRKRNSYPCRYFSAFTDANNNTWAVAVEVFDNAIEVETLPSSYMPADHPMELGSVVIINHF